MAALDLTHLKYFQAIAEHGSLTAAAKKLQVSQPTLTVAMRNLEERLGTTLLLRSRSGVLLTATGKELLGHADDIFALLERAEQRITGLESEDVGSFVIGCHESLGAYFLPEFMIGFLQAHPRIEVNLSNASSAEVTEAVVARRVDFALIVNPIPHPELVLLELFKDAMDFFVASSVSTPDEASAHARLRDGPLVFAGRVRECQDLLGRLSAEGMLPARMLSCGDLELVKSFALAGLGVALLPRRVADYGQRGMLRRLHPSLPFFPDTIFLAFRADMHKTRAATRLKDALVAHGRGLPDVR